MTGAKIMEARRKLGWSREELGTALGVSHWTVMMWEQGRRRPCCHLMEAKLVRTLKRKPRRRRE